LKGIFWQKPVSTKSQNPFHSKLFQQKSQKPVSTKSQNLFQQKAKTRFNKKQKLVGFS
jgi:hypothetical protein